MDENRQLTGRVTVRFRRRDDGGLRAYCSEVPGFFLSSIHKRDVMHDVIPALEMLLEANFNLHVQVSPLGYGIYELIEQPSAEETIPDLPEYTKDYAVVPFPIAA